MNNLRKKSASFILVWLFLLSFDLKAQAIINVPLDYSTVTTALSAASDGDTILVAPGTYQEAIEIPNKSLVLASWFLTTEDTSYISQTILDGNGGNSVINISGSVAASPTIIGFTIQDADDGISPHARFTILNCYITDCSDGIDYEDGSGGVCKFNVFEYNSDDGIDLDNDVDIIIEDNIIRNNGDDGIEVRLQSYDGPVLNCIIRRNLIYGNDEDGIQLIDYNSVTDRFFLIERNLFYNNAMVGLGCMGNSNTTENYEGASIPERIFLFNNTFVGNNYGVTGGDSLVSVNNIFVDHPGIAMKNVSGASIASYGIYWNNGTNFENSNVDNPHIILSDPLLNPQYHLQFGSPAIDAGTAIFIWQGGSVLNLPSSSYDGMAPDLGAFEFIPPSMLMVTNPNGGEVWEGGSIQNITWNSAGTSGMVGIEYSADNGLNWNDIFPSIPDDGTRSWSVPDTATAKAILRISDKDENGPVDSSDTVFAISIAPMQTIRFANIGDYGDAGEAEQDVTAMISSWNVDFIFTNGDNNYPDGEASTIDDNIGQYFREHIDNYQGGYAGNDPPINGFFPCLGNHDWRTSAGNPEIPYPYLDYFTLPGAGISTTGTSGNERYYDFVIGAVHFFAIDSDSHEPDGRTSTSIQGQWLQAELAASTSDWNVVFMHHPPYSSSSNHGSETEMQWPYEDWGADVVFAGHDHTYERILKDDNNDGVPMLYFVNGLGGRSIYSFGTPIPGSQVRYADDYGAMLIEANENSMTFQFYSRTGQLIDAYTALSNPAQVLVEIKMFVEGPYNSSTGEMTTHLNTNEYIPEISPYSEDPRSVPPPLPPTVTDWVLVELREAATDPAVVSKSAFLRNDGRIVADDGITEQITMNASGGNYYIVVKHRNHLAVMSAGSVQLSSGSSTLYDFTIGAGQYYGVGGAKQVETGIWGMWAGDIDQSRTVDANDRAASWNDRNKTGYHNSDCQLSGTVDANSRAITWNNRNKISTLP